MFCHEAPEPPWRRVMKCHEMSCSACVWFMFREPFGHNARPIYLPSARVHRRPGRPKSEPCCRHRRQCGRGSVAVIVPPPPTGSGSLFRAYPARVRARVGAGAVRAPDCAREAEGALLPSASHGFSKMAPPGRAAPGKAAPDSASSGHCSTLLHISSPKQEYFMKCERIPLPARSSPFRTRAGLQWMPCISGMNSEARQKRSRLSA